MPHSGPSLVDTESFLRQWEAVQAKHADLPGEDAARRRAEAYAPFFLGFGERVYIGAGCRFYHPHRIVLEEDARFNDGALVYGSGGVHVGRHARIGPRFFVHSANHDTGASPLAFHERGYDYATVRIGDDCLISANVSVLPGAILGPGTFVAAGAVVTGRTYPDDARLAGVPAKAMAMAETTHVAVAAPVIAVLGAAGADRTVALARIAAALGLPQVAVHAEGPLPASVCHAIVLDAAGDATLARAGRGRSVVRWTIDDGAVRPAASLVVETENGERLECAGRRVVVTAPAACGAAGATRRDVARIALYYAIKRMRKRTRNAAEELDLLLAAAVLRTVEDDSARAVADAILDLLNPDGGTSRRRTAVDAADLASAMVARLRPGARIRSALESRQVSLISAADVTGLPDLLPVTAALAGRSPETARLAPAAMEFLRTAEKAWSVAAVGAFGLLAGQDEVLRAALARLASPALLDPSTACVHSAVGATGYAYHALVGALFAAAASADGDPLRLDLEEERSSDVLLGVFADRRDEAAWVAGQGALACSASHRISAGLVDAWIAAMTPPAIDGGQIELTDAAYDPLVPAIHAAWRAILRRMILGAGQPFIEVLPWPDGAPAAVSVRYDIDRATLPGQVRQIVEIQQRRFGRPCGSWYAIPGTEHGPRIDGTLRQHLQEVGVHAIRGDHEQAAGAGVTVHSAPGSEYWRGRSTVLAHAGHGAAYTELLSGGADRPMPAWLPGGTGGPGTEVWVTPLHFPLEGSTKDVDLGYFDRLRERFRGRIARCGHAIIGSHPDLNQEMLPTLAERERLDRCWAAPVIDVVDRCRRLLSAGAVTVVAMPDDARPHLVAARTVADVAVRIERDGGAEIQVVQLIAGQPRPIEPADAAGA